MRRERPPASKAAENEEFKEFKGEPKENFEQKAAKATKNLAYARQRFLVARSGLD